MGPGRCAVAEASATRMASASLYTGSIERPRIALGHDQGCCKRGLVSAID
jgi:hypothetical protein